MNIEQLAREAGLGYAGPHHPGATQGGLRYFAALVIAAGHKRLLEGSGEPVAVTLRFEGDERLCLSCVFDTVGEAEEYRDFRTTGHPDIVELYTADQMAAAVLRERERCAAIADKWSKRADDVGGYLAAAIRGQQ